MMLQLTAIRHRVVVFDFRSFDASSQHIKSFPPQTIPHQRPFNKALFCCVYTFIPITLEFQLSPDGISFHPLRSKESREKKI